MSDEDMICQICQKVIYDGDEVVRALEGKIFDVPCSINLDVWDEMWFHSGCFHQWKNVIDIPEELEDFEEIGIKTREDGSTIQFFKKKEE